MNLIKRRFWRIIFIISEILINQYILIAISSFGLYNDLNLHKKKLDQINLMTLMNNYSQINLEPKNLLW